MSLRKLGISTFGVVGALLLTAGVVHAATSSDTEDHFSAKAGTIVKGSLKSGTKMTFVGTITGISVTVTCTTFTGSGAVPAKGLSVTLSKPPTISGCTDSLGGTDTVVTNQTNGKWKLSEVDAANDESAAEPNTGDKARLTIPKAGASFSSSILSGCTITAAPNGPASITGSYNDKGTDTVKHASIPVVGSGSFCTATASAVTATVVLSPLVHDVS
jgi:hypothetical protein